MNTSPKYRDQKYAGDILARQIEGKPCCIGPAAAGIVGRVQRVYMRRGGFDFRCRVLLANGRTVRVAASDVHVLKGTP